MKNKTQFQFKAEVNAEKALNNVDTGRVCTLNIKNFPKCGLRFPQKKKLTKWKISSFFSWLGTKFDVPKAIVLSAGQWAGQQVTLSLYTTKLLYDMRHNSRSVQDVTPDK